jgi:hypothetical protein
MLMYIKARADMATTFLLKVMARLSMPHVHVVSLSLLGMLMYTKALADIALGFSASHKTSLPSH